MDYESCKQFNLISLVVKGDVEEEEVDLFIFRIQKKKDFKVFEKKFSILVEFVFYQFFWRGGSGCWEWIVVFMDIFFYKGYKVLEGIFILFL